MSEWGGGGILVCQVTVYFISQSEGGFIHTSVSFVSKLHGVVHELKLAVLVHYTLDYTLHNKEVRAMGLKSLSDLGRVILGTGTMVAIFQA